MSHLHIPDGVLPIWLIAIGWILTGIFLAIVSRRLSRGDSARQLPLLGVMAAVMLVGMSTEIVPIAYHINLSVLAGIVLGPALGFLAAVIVNLMIAMFGHGGITVVGLNSLVIGFEAVAGYLLFRAFWRALRSRSSTPFVAAGIATFLTLAFSTTLMIGVVGLSNLDPSVRNVVDTEHLTFRNPFDSGFVASEFAGAADEHAVEAEQGGPLNVADFARLVYILGLAGWVLESAVTAAIAGYVHRVRPGLVVPVAPAGRPADRPEGHGHGLS